MAKRDPAQARKARLVIAEHRPTPKNGVGFILVPGEKINLAPHSRIAKLVSQAVFMRWPSLVSDLPDGAQKAIRALGLTTSTTP